ncbi:MAG: Ldh family oxidoreductase, partial [Nitrospinae bacterium]|nr:Ldh family oxidoreductase [Nitrospinota bacterium]
RFKVPHADEVRVPEQSLRRTVTAIFEKMGLSPEDAAEGADVLVTTDLRGVETHGVSNMLRSYVQGYRSSTLNPRPNWRIVRSSPGTAVIDGDRGLGIILGPKAMRIAIDKARSVGIGIVTLYNNGHLGAVGHHAMLAAKEDMVGVCMSATSVSVVPTFGAEPRFGTNPISIAAPARHEGPFLFDAATSAIAGNKVRLAARVGSTLLPGWVTDKEGNPIMEETPAVERGQYFHLPLGGTREQGSHKGYGFAMMAEILGSLLSGALPCMLDPTSGFKHYFAAYNIAAFTDVEGFKDIMDRMLQTLRNTRPARGHDRVLYPGFSEYEEEQDRRAKGIPLHKEVIRWFEGVTNELSIPPLATM